MKRVEIMEYRKNLEDLKPYKPGQNIEEIKIKYKINEIIKLASNENVYGCSQSVMQKLKDIKNINIYPDNYCTKLREKLSKKYDVQPQEFVFGNGSVEIIQMLSRVLLNEDDEIITGMPSFQSYVLEAIIQNAKVVEVDLINYCFNLKEILYRITDKTKMIYIANPNNPTGTIVSENELRTFLDNVPQNILVVLDEAYSEYVLDEKYPDSVKLMKEYSNICILKTFSKAYGLAGIRIGYAISNSNLINELEKVRVPFNVSSLSQEMAIVALEDQKFVNDCKRKNREVMEYIYKALDNLNIKYIKSQANFIMIDLEEDSKSAYEKLLKRGFIVRPNFPNMPTYVRVTLGTIEEMKKFINVLKDIREEF